MWVELATMHRAAGDTPPQDHRVMLRTLSGHGLAAGCACTTGNKRRSCCSGLGQCNGAIPIRRHRVAMIAISGVPAAVTHDPRLLLALDVTVDACHPGADLVHQLTLTNG